MDFGKLIRRAWEITWRYKFLWIFGIAIAFCRAGGGSGSNFNFNSRNFSGQNNPFGQFTNPINPFPQTFERFFSSGLLWLFIGVLIVLVIIFFVIGMVVVAYARGSLIRSVDLIENGESVNFRRAWEEGKKSFRRLFGMEILINIPGLLVGVAIVIAVILLVWNLISSGGMAYSAGQNAFWRALLTIAPAFVIIICSLACIAFLIQILVAILEVFGSRAIVLEDLPIMAALTRGWKLFLANIAPAIILAFILFGISLGIGIVIGLPIALLIGGFMVVIMGIAHLAGPAWLVFVPIIVLMVLAIAILASFVRGVYLVFTETLWTLAYRDFIGAEGSLLLKP
ncbi:MAG: DUF7544 domain-containing protein [Anaerolineales bacterium]